MSEGIRINVPATPNFVRLYPSRREKVIHMLPRALQVGHRVRDGHERGQFTLPHNHPPPMLTAASNKADATDAGTHAETPR